MVVSQHIKTWRHYNRGSEINSPHCPACDPQAFCLAWEVIQETTAYTRAVREFQHNHNFAEDLQSNRDIRHTNYFSLYSDFWYSILYAFHYLLFKSVHYSSIVEQHSYCYLPLCSNFVDSLVWCGSDKLSEVWKANLILLFTTQTRSKHTKHSLGMCL